MAGVTNGMAGPGRGAAGLSHLPSQRVRHTGTPHPIEGEPCPMSPHGARAPLCSPTAGEVESPPLGVQEGSSWGAGGSDEAFLGLVKGKEQESCTDTQMLLFQVVWFPRLSLSFPRCSGELEPCLVLAPGTAAGGRSGAHLQAKSS